MRVQMRRRQLGTIAALFLATKGMLAFAEGRDRFVSPEEREDAQSAAFDLLTKIDKVPLSFEELKALYFNSGSALKQRYKAREYDARLRSVRGPLGTVQNRVFAGYGGAYFTLPNIIPGDYIIIGFHTLFSESKGMYTEQITLEKDRAGAKSFHLVEYYVAPLDDSK